MALGWNLRLAIGLVLCGGGARCFAHLGVYKALQEAGIQVDHVGGSGMGAVTGALIALDAPADELIACAREAFTANPTGDVSLMPITSLIKGRQLRGILDEAVEHLSRDVNQDVHFDEIPGSWALAWDKLTGSRRQFRVPSLMSTLMNATTLYSASRERFSESMTDLEFKLHLPSVGILDWHAFDHAVDVGYRNAARTLAEMPREELAPFRAS